MQKFGFLEKWSYCIIYYCILNFVVDVIRCSDHTVLQEEHRNHLLSRHPRATDVRASTANSFGNAVSFTGREVIKLRLDGGTSFPSKEFSVQFWLKPEGGQYRFTPIIGMYKKCYIKAKEPSNAINNCYRSRFVTFIEHLQRLQLCTLQCHEGYLLKRVQKIFGQRHKRLII